MCTYAIRKIISYFNYVNFTLGITNFRIDPEHDRSDLFEIEEQDENRE